MRNTLSRRRISTRIYGILFFGIVYLIFTIVFCVHLALYDDATPGRCYNALLTSSPTATHPAHDYIYIAITGCWFYLLLAGCLAVAIRTNRKLSSCSNGNEVALSQVEWVFRKTPKVEVEGLVILFSSFLYPVHLWSAISLRQANQTLLTPSGGENHWGFGQMVTLVMIAGVVIECCKGVMWYMVWNCEAGEQTSCAQGTSHVDDTAS